MTPERMVDAISKQAADYGRGEAVENPYPKDSFAYAQLELRRSGRRLGYEVARAVGIYWLLNKLSALLKQ